MHSSLRSCICTHRTLHPSNRYPKSSSCVTNCNFRQRCARSCAGKGAEGTGQHFYCPASSIVPRLHHGSCRKRRSPWRLAPPAPLERKGSRAHACCKTVIPIRTADLLRLAEQDLVTCASLGSRPSRSLKPASISAPQAVGLVCRAAAAPPPGGRFHLTEKLRVKQESRHEGAYG
jgi:hypothetical protein